MCYFFKVYIMRYFLPVIMFALFSSCNALKPEEATLKLDGQRWTLTAIKHKPINGGGNAYLEFQDNLDVKGKAFCNSINAEYELMGKDQLTFSDIVSTKMFCDGVMNLENEMITHLQAVKRYEIKNGMLYLHDSESLLLTFKK